ncbi:MAG: hypothetical protein CMG69_03900 [Candidatus Marinimicrobia bacterium]|nr:hypothetical protein [Candidatus Neomarinimicrobiota bacterium]|tara:strand:- start:106 stop:555 length:450 start_codon:yes stop_codon:yes gene_type:complete
MNHPLVLGYRHTGIIVKNMRKSIHFYRDLLGLEVIQDFNDDSEYINKITGIRNGAAHFIKLKMQDGSVLELLEYPTHPTEKHSLGILNVGICHIALRVKCANDAYNFLLKQGIKVLSEPVLSSEGIAKVFFCIDPDGVRVEMVEMLDEK